MTRQHSNLSNASRKDTAKKPRTDSRSEDEAEEDMNMTPEDPSRGQNTQELDEDEL